MSETTPRRRSPRAWLPATLLALLLAAPAAAQPVDMLLIQDTEPWNADAWQSELMAAGVNWTQIQAAQIQGTDLTQYKMVITSSVQGSDYNETLNLNIGQFETYVDGGGVLVWSAATNAYETPFPQPPYSGNNAYYTGTENYVMNVAHALMDGVPATMSGYWVSHNYFSGYSQDAEVLATHSGNGGATLYLLHHGMGVVIVSGLTWEVGLDNPSWGTGQILVNTIQYGIDFEPCLGVDADGDGWTDCDMDCDDTDASIHPGAAETCNDGIDQNCDEQYDEMADEDGDGYTNCSGDCNDFEAESWPGNTEVCDFVDNDCDGWIDEGFDQDGDGWSACNGDCNDNDPQIYPNQLETCDGQDNDCDNIIDEQTDDDGDGITVCGGDCNDTNASIYPGAPEICDGLDNDCDGSPATYEYDQDGDGYLECEECDDTNPTVYPGAEEICDDGLDSDCAGDYAWTEEDNDGDGFSECSDDCDDENPTTYPGAPELCNGLVDDDCNPATDEIADIDLDGFNICQGDCDDLNAGANPDATEICDGVDNDCNGIADDNLDYDLDGVPGCGGEDCDDHNPNVYPGAPEVPYDSIDQDCDGEDLADVDGDGYDGGPYGTDCDDQNINIHPAAVEDCSDGIDGDCDGVGDAQDDDCAEIGDDDDDSTVDPGITCSCDQTATLAPARWGELAGVALLALLGLARRRTRNP